MGDASSWDVFNLLKTIVGTMFDIDRETVWMTPSGRKKLEEGY